MSVKDNNIIKFILYQMRKYFNAVSNSYGHLVVISGLCLDVEMVRQQFNI